MTGTVKQGRSGPIVAGVDGSETSKDALRWAARQAEMTKATLDAVMTWETSPAVYGYAVPAAASYNPEPQLDQELRAGAHDFGLARMR
jgi:nucleotide-binding universal stress UspA family protein